jgi:hypothetical protein
MIKYITYTLLTAALFLSCAEETITETKNTDWLEIDPAKSNIDFNNKLTPDINRNILEYLYYYNGGGVAVGDLDNDGFEDIYFSGNEVPDRLYFNKGNFVFEDRTEESKIISSNSWSTGVSIDDVNNDGALDIYVCKVGLFSDGSVHNLLYINNGDGTFSESSEQYGLDFYGFSTQASFFDYDQDGDLDMYLLNHSIHSPRSYGNTDKRAINDSISGDRLYENRLNETENKFVDVTAKSNIYSSALGYGLCVVTSDINGDNLIDIYVGNDFHENDYLYINQGDGTFIESIADYMSHTSKFTMGVDIADMNNDNLKDIYSTDMLPFSANVAMKSGGEDTDQIFNIRKDFGFEGQYARNNFQLQRAPMQFQDIALATETYATDWSWAALLQDFNNDGKNDIFVSNGIVHRPNDLDYINFLNSIDIKSQSVEDKKAHLDEMLSLMPSQALNNILFTQKEDLQFTELKNSMIGPKTFSNGAAYADLNNDGTLDLICNNINQKATILNNKSNANNNYLTINLEDKSNKTTKNSKVSIYSGELKIHKDYVTTRGYQSSCSHLLHFGLNSNNKVDSIIIVWPDDSIQKIENVESNQRLTITKESSNQKFKKRKADDAKPLVFQFRHNENKYLDSDFDVLMPELLSKEGPAGVSADFNGDGLNDIFIGGASLQEPVLFLANKNGSYTAIDNRDFKVDAKYEDTAAATIDFDKDGDLDLYVASGGNQNTELDKLLEDRIYLNDGKGNLKRIPISLPHTNGGTVSVADYDNDGYDDIFIGARSIPFSYGLSPYSFILNNKSGQGVTIAYKERYGMITDSQWVDYDNDDDLDLLFCGDWMGIVIMQNQGNGTLKYQSDDIGLGQYGMWNAIDTYDYNNDGVLDIIGANVGTNFKWKVDDNKGVTMSVLDIDGNKKTEPLIYYNYMGVDMPFASLDKLKSQAPILKKQFSDYQSFSKVRSISDIDAANGKAIVESKQLNNFYTTLFLSENGKFKPIPLDGMIQYSTIQDIEINNQGDMIYVANSNNMITELGQNSGLSGGILSQYDSETQQFTSDEALNLPFDINTRQILDLDESRYLILCNDDYQYIINKPSVE